MKISKKDALAWFTFFAQLQEAGETLTVRQQEVALAVLRQLELAARARRDAIAREIPGLKSLRGRTFYVGEEKQFPRGCVSCLFGSGLSAVRKTNRCNLRCPFCYDYGCTEEQPPIGEGMWEIGGTRFAEEDLLLLLDIQKKPTGVAYVYLEPFMEIERYYGVIRRFHEAGVYQHMYTNGTLATPENLAALGEAGLDELRFNLGATNAADGVIDAIAEAKRHIPAVGIETPMTPALYRVFLEKKEKILATGVDFINFAELHLNPNNIGNYWGESFYIARQGYLSPFWSRELTLRMMKLADQERWPVLVHDCSNRTKFARDLHQKAVEGGWFGASSWGGEFEAIPYEALIPALQDPDIVFAQEEPLPPGYRFGECF